PDASPLQLLETGMQMMRTADSHWPESLQQQQATAQWNEILKTRAQSSPQITQWEYIYKNNWIRWITPNIKWTRYLFNNPQIMKFGVGAAAMTEGIVKGTRYSVLFSGAFHVLEFIFKSEYDFADFFVDVSMDVAKLMVAQIVLKAVAGILDFLALR
ncbi:ImpA domain protein, partial [Salmonella enterica subsp. enterica serovar Agona str. ATCC BAA-707]